MCLTLRGREEGLTLCVQPSVAAKKASHWVSDPPWPRKRDRTVCSTLRGREEGIALFVQPSAKKNGHEKKKFHEIFQDPGKFAGGVLTTTRAPRAKKCEDTKKKAT